MSGRRQLGDLITRRQALGAVAGGLVTTAAAPQARAATPASAIRRTLWAATVRTKTLAERIRVAELAGCTHLTVFPSDFRGWEQNGLSPVSMRQMLRSANVKTLAIDPFGLWVPGFAFPQGYPEIARVHFDFTEDEIFRMADVLEAEQVNLVEPLRGPFVKRYDTRILVEGFAKFAQKALRRGLTTTLEFMPVSSVPDLALASEIVTRSGGANTGICFDTWHFFRGSADLELLARLPQGLILEVQISDARREIVGDLLNDLLHHRLFPGEGDFNLRAAVRALKARGNYRSVGPEIFSDVVDGMSPDQIGARCRVSLDTWS